MIEINTELLYIPVKSLFFIIRTNIMVYLTVFLRILYVLDYGRGKNELIEDATKTIYTISPVYANSVESLGGISDWKGLRSQRRVTYSEIVNRSNSTTVMIFPFNSYMLR